MNSYSAKMPSGGKFEEVNEFNLPQIVSLFLFDKQCSPKKKFKGLLYKKI